MWYYLFPIFLFGENMMLTIGKRIGTILHKNNKITKYSEIFQENFVGLYHHVSSSALLCYIMYNNNWCLNKDGSVSFTDTIYCIDNSTDKNLYIGLICFELSHYITSIFNTLFFKKNRREDETMLFVHHIVTIFLIWYSTIVSVGEFGAIYILFTHNLCDIPIHIYLIGKNLKLANIQMNDSLMKIVDYANGVILIGLWSYLRLYMYGSFVLFVTYSFPYISEMYAKIAFSILYIFDVIWFYMTLQSFYYELIKSDKKSILYGDNLTIKEE